MIENLTFLPLALFSITTVTALSVVLQALFPEIIREYRTQIEEARKRMFWIGVVNTGFLAILMFLITNLGGRSGNSLLFIPAILIIAFFVAGSLFGLIGTFQLIGDKTFSDLAAIKKQSFAAAITLAAALTPFIGWFLLFPYLILVSFGSFITVTFQRRKRSKTSEEGES